MVRDLEPELFLVWCRSRVEDELVQMLRTTWPDGPDGPLCGAHRQSTQWVSHLRFGPYEMIVPDEPVGAAGALVFRDASRRVGLLDLRPLVTPSEVQQLLAHLNSDLDIHVTDDFTVYRSMRVTEVVRQPERECTIDEAHEVDVDARLGDDVYWPIPMSWGHLVLRWFAHRQQGLPTRALL